MSHRHTRHKHAHTHTLTHSPRTQTAFLPLNFSVDDAVIDLDAVVARHAVLYPASRLAEVLLSNYATGGLMKVGSLL
jgi:hypothetical protein